MNYELEIANFKMQILNLKLQMANLAPRALHRKPSIPKHQGTNQNFTIRH